MTEDMENRYAIVGMGGIFPDAPDLGLFWRNILDKRVSIAHLPADSDERRIYFRPEVARQLDKRDKTYTDLSAAIDSFEFDPERFRIPPAVAMHMDENQKIALLATEQALASHGLESVAKERVAVVMGASGYGTLHHDFHRRVIFDRVAHQLEHASFVDAIVPAAQRTRLVEQLRERVLAGTFGITEDSAPGMLPSIIATRIASVFDLHGQAMVVDSACASALAALSCSLQQLQLHQADAVICGAVDMPNHELGRIYFSAIGALSPDGAFPFDARANGFVIGQGGGVLVLKRLEDAVDRGDCIYAVVAGHGVVGDGKGKAIAAPNEIWQAQAIRSAYEAAGYAADTVEMIEAHGTSTQVGDKSEMNALKRAFKALGAARTGFCGVGSVKSNIGHLKAAAGIAGLLKATLAIHHKWLPPTASFQRLSPAIDLSDSPFYVLADGKAWPEGETPRRAGVSAFAFGGANYHVALEEYRREQHGVRPPRLRPSSSRVTCEHNSGGTSEVALFAAATSEQLLEQVEEIRRQLTRDLDVREVLADLNAGAGCPRRERLAFAVHARADLTAKLELIGACQGKREALKELQPRGVWYSAEPAIAAGQVALLFPGQGSQYPGMLGYVRRRFVAARTLEVRANRLWQKLAGTSVSALIDPEDGDMDAAGVRLRETANTHPAVLTASLAAYAVLEQMGLRATVMLGHSLGEYSALVAAGRLSLGEGLMLMRARGTALTEACAGQAGAMLALVLDEAATTALIAEARLPLTVANRNSPRQTIVAGAEDAIAALRSLASDRGHKAVVLNVSRAFHSPLMQDAERAFEADLRSAGFRPGHPPVLSSVDAQIFGDTAEAVQATLSRQMTSPVDFVAAVERLYADGIRLFVEVGPSAVLAGLTREILGERPGLVLASDGRKGDSDEAFLRLLCALHVAGLPIDPSAASPSAASPSAASPSAASTDATPSRRPSETVRASATSAPKSEPPAPTLRNERIVYSGVSVGLPGSFRDAFRDDNFEQLFEGRNFIERLTDDERRALLDLHISKVVKSEQGACIVELQTLNEVIQLAGKLGRLDLAGNYQVDDKELQTMSTCVAHAVAAGFEALRDAQIPLVLEYNRTTSGRLLPDRWALPRAMQATTGIIFANGFPLIEPVIAEVSRHLSHTLGNRTRAALLDFYDGLIARVTHAESRKLLQDWFGLNYGRLCPSPGQEQVYRFNHQLMTQSSLQANNRLAKRINARGPNFQLNAACSSAATAIMLAEELIRGGRVERMIIIGADDPTSAAALPYLGAGFLATGACTNEGDLYQAAIPFDQRRNGMIMGSGAMAIVVEAEPACTRRGLAPVCELLGTHAFNAASHGSQLDVARYADELETFIARMERCHGISRTAVAPELVYFSHEPYTPPRGGCSEAEAVALRHVFGAQVGQVEVTNTKGMTGHTMGASIEDVTAAKALQLGRLPPVVNHKVADPSLANLRLSRGGQRRFEYALRMAAGFGSQGNYVLLKRAASGDARIASQASYQAWLREISCQDTPALIELGRMLVIKDASPGAVISERPRVDCTTAAATTTAEVGRPRPEAAPAAPASVPASTDSERTRDRVLDVVAAITGYKRALLDLDMELEADLGVDTVKQATILAKLAEDFGMAEMQKVRLSDYPTLRALIGLFAAGPVESAAAPGPDGVTADVAEIVSEIVAQVTGYRLALVEPSMELEADLGVDTVKQATILAKLAERFSLAQDSATFRISDFPTVGHLSAFFARAVGGATAPITTTTKATPTLDPAPAARASEATDDRPGPQKQDAHARLIALLTACTPYPAEMLEPDLTLDADLGLDAATRERLRKACIEDFALDGGWQLPVDTSIAELAAQLSAARPEAAQPAGQPPACGIARQILSLQPAAQDGDGDGDGRRESLTDKRVWVWGDDLACVQSLQASLAGLVREVRTFAFPPSGSPDESVQRAAAELDSVAPDILVDTTACGTCVDFESAGPEAFARSLARAADCRFAVWKSLLGRQVIPARTIVVTAIDGAHGLAGLGESLNPLFGLYAGFYKALRRLGRDRNVLILDLAPTALALDHASSLPWAPLLAELVEQGPGVEICYRNGVRHRVALADAVPPSPRAALPDDEVDEVIVATGGGAGITAAILRELVECTAGHTGHVALVGRTAIGPETRRFHALARQAREAEKETIREQLARDGHRKVTPVMVDKAYAALERAAEIHDTLAALEAAGTHVTYHQADVRDRAGLESVLTEIRRVHGPITTLIHGAGLEISRTIEKKSLEEFQSVHRTKTLGAWNLSWLCRGDPLRRVVAISSIAGRFGSPAQVDYSAANGFLDLWARMYQQRPGMRGTSLIWSAWAEQGMAWRNAFVRENAERSGLGFIDPRVGARAAVAEILADGAEAEVVFHQGLGEVGDPELMGNDPAGSPFIDWCARAADGTSAFGRRFSVKRDAMLDQHRFGSTPLMPGVGLMEMMAEAHALTTEQHHGALVFRQLEFADALKFYRDEARDVQVRIAATPVEPGGALSMQAWSPFRSALGTVVEDRLYASALVSREAANPLDASPASWALGDGERMTFQRALGPVPSSKRGIALGPLLNDASRSGHDPASSEVLLGEIGIVTRIPFPRAQLTEPRYPHARLHANPAFLDCMHQAAAVFCVLKTGAIHLPVGAQEFTLFEVPNQDARYEVIARICERLPDRIFFDVALLREGGTLCCFARKVALRRTGQ